MEIEQVQFEKGFDHVMILAVMSLYNKTRNVVITRNHI